MSHWGNNASTQPPAPNQVTFFDPTKFQQKDTSNTGFQQVPVSQQNAVAEGQGHVDGQQSMNYHGDQTNSWNTWGKWDNTNPYAGDFNGGASDQNGQAMNNDYTNYNQQQYYGHQQWNNDQQTSDPGSAQWNNVPQNNPGAVQWNNVPHTNADPSSQWNQQQYNYQQQMDPNRAGYQNYWGGQNGDIQSQGDFPNTCTSVMQNASSANYYGVDPSVQYAQSEANIPLSNVTNSAAVTGEGESSGLDVSQSTESGSGLNQSLGNVEDGGMGGFFHNDDYDENDSEETDDDEDDDVEEDEEESNDENNSNLGASGSHLKTENESEHNSAGIEVQVTQQNISVSQQQHFEMTGQMQTLSIQDSVSSNSGYGGSYNAHVPNIPQYSNQSNVNPVLAGQPMVPPTAVHPFVPTLVENLQGEVNADNVDAEPRSEKQETPTFSDWEMVPTQSVAVSHSRNASVDNNVQFFIGSGNNSARVSPAASAKTGEDQGGVQAQGVPKLNENKPDISQSVGQSNPPQVINASNQQNVGLPPPMMGGNTGINPFRKSPNMELVSTTSATDVSILSSTRLDVTRPNFENSPVVLNQSISPIPTSMERKGDGDNESPEIQAANQGHVFGQDTPVSTQSRKSKAPSQSPIMPRKESPFQPPKQDARGKPVKASHDIPGVNPQKSASDSSKPIDCRDRTTAERDHDKGYGRKTPDWDADTKGYEGRRTPDTDRRRRNDRDRDDRDKDRSYREHDRYGADNERLLSRPPTGSGATERPSTRTRQSAFHHIQTNRSKNNVSPAASLLDIADSVPAMSNILLMPASSVSGGVSPNPVTVSGPTELTPVVSLISSMSEQMSTDNGVADKRDPRESKSSDRDRDSKDRYREKDRYRDEKSRYTRDRDRGSKEDLRGNRSYDNLRDRGFKDSRNNSREKLSMYGSRDSLDERDDSRDRTRRGDSRERDRSYRDEYYDRYRDRNRPQSRGSTVDTRRDYKDRDRDRDREYYRRTDKYDRDRPRSRQGDRDRPMSRQADSERPRSRADYDREIERYREKYKGYGDYDDYYRRHYYDKQYYDYYYNSGQYNQGGYYDEHGYFHADPNAQRYQYDHYHRRSRTGTPGSLSDGGEEIASIADTSKKSATESNKKRFDYPPDLHDYSRGGYQDYYSYYGYEQNGHRWDPNISEWVATTTDVEPQRQTPEKFMIPHMRACFGPNGQLVKVMANRPADGQPATVEIHDVHEMLEETEEAQVLDDFPGPLVRGDTHKNDVLLFCQRKAKSCTENMNMEDRESAEIIWKFLELLIKQNGTIVGTDIADLILQGHEPTTVEFRRSGMKIAASSDNLDDGDSEDGQKLSRGSTPIDRSFVNKTKSTEEVTDRFRHLLMFGRKKDAIDWAMKNSLWGHALFLASKMDSRAHANVMARFANVAMRMNDPLQTLYQLMSGRQPAAVTSVAEERWGDWRPHLAMILSNTSQKADLDRKSITTLGDTLASKGFLHASHFCYLMSQTSFGSYNKKSSKIVLIGSSHGLPLEYFANNEAIQCTEIYEYALALSNMAMSLVNFQTYKFLYATRLADYGYAQEALQYCEVISKSINMNPAWYQHTLVKLVYDLSSQLKFSDPQDNDNEEILDPDWLRALHTTLVQFEEGAIQPMSGNATPAYFGGRTTASSDSGEVGMYMQGADNGSMYTQDSLYVPNNGGGMYSIHENTQYTHQSLVDDQSLQYQQQHQTTQYGQGYDTSQVDQYNTQQQTDGTIQPVQTAPGTENQYSQQQYQDNGSIYQHQGQTVGQGEAQWAEQPAVDSTYQHQGGFESTNQNQAYTANQHTDVSHQHTAGQYNTNFGAHEVPNHWSRQKQPSLPQNVNLADSQSSAVSGQHSSLASTSEDGLPDEGEDHVDSAGFEPTPSIFDIQSTQGKIIPPKLRKRTISETSTGSAPSVTKPQSEPKKSDSNDSMSLSKQKQAAGGGIWGKLGGLFTRKNEMKLPDDKEPSIVWDPEKKKWVDKDADEKDDVPAAPPPKDHELSGSAPVRKSSMPEPGPQTGPASIKDMPPTGGNKFSLKKGIGPKYVDVMNPKPASTTQVPSSLFHTLPNSHSAPAIFNPMGGSSDGQPSEPAQESIPEEKSNAGADNSSNTQTGNIQLPPSSTTNLSRNSSGSSLSREVQRIMSKALPGQTSALPTMFNPAQFQGNQTFKQPAPSGPGHRLSNRRVYPK